MIYKILIKGANGSMNYATMRKEILEKVIENDEIVEKPTGKYKVVDFETTDKNEVKDKYITLLDQYKKDALDVVADMKEIVTITVDIQDADESEDNNTNDDTNTGDNGTGTGDGESSNPTPNPDENQNGSSEPPTGNTDDTTPTEPDTNDEQEDTP